MASSSRRRREVLSDDSEDDDAHASETSSAKRQRLEEEDTETPQSTSPTPEVIRDLSDNVVRTRGGGHQPGAIVNIKVTDFVTYESAEFGLGPHLNMIIGPNGTGKSSLVCAIALGLGYPPKVLGRALNIGEYVKHGCESATIEIELKCKRGESSNHHVKVRIIKDGDKRKWWINDSSATLQSVQKLRESFGIQCDNLCQFLPQDRVAEFAGLSPVDLLHHTQRAAAPAQMLQWHDELIKLREEEKRIQFSHQAERETITNLEARQESLRADVERLRDREAIQSKIEKLEKTRPFVEYVKARDDHDVHKARKQRAKARMQRLQEEVEPTLKAITKKEDYRNKVKAVVDERKKVVSICEKSSDTALNAVKALEQEVTEISQKRQAELDADKARKQDLQTVMTKIRDLEAQLKNAPPEFDAPSWNARIREKDGTVRQLSERARDIKNEIQQKWNRGGEIRVEKDRLVKAVENLETQAGKQAHKLRAYNKNLAQAWAVVQENQDLFSETVYGPAAVTCTVNDARYADHLESLVKGNLMSLFTVTNNGDARKLNDLLITQRGFPGISSRTVPHVLDETTRHFGRPNLSDEEFKAMGIDGWAIDYIEGPEPVVAMLCINANLGRIPVSLKDISPAQHQLVSKAGIDVCVIGRTSYATSRRREYGAGAVATTTSVLRAARLWIDQPTSNSGEKEQLQSQLDDLASEFTQLKSETQALKADSAGIHDEIQDIKREQDELRTKKAELQKAASYFNAIPNRLAIEKESLAKKRERGLQVVERVLAIDLQLDALAIEKLEKALKHKETVEKLRLAHESLLEAQIISLEAESECDTLAERNNGVKIRLEAEKERVAKITEEAETAKTTARAALATCQAILEEEDEEGQEYFKNLPQDVSLESVEEDLLSERAKLEFAHGGNAGAIDEWHKREEKLESLREKMNANTAKLEKMNQRILKVRERWEPALDTLIEKISDAFSDNFSRISCAGEVKVHKDDDFDQWSIQIWVKFRESESLQLLDQHRQSGGERSVSTIFYLMSLQSLALAPFRVVDEINQGMDPRNERMVHGRMVDIACQEYTSQYFLITPKLLTNLSYSPMMKTLIINSGEFMPKETTKFDLGKVLDARRALMAQ